MNWFKNVVKSILIVVFLIPFQTMACPESVQVLEKGQTANCTGFLFSPEAEEKAAQDYADARHYKLINERLTERKELTDKEIGILDKRLQLYVNQSETLAKELHRRESQNTWERVLWFGLGVLATGIAIEGVSKLK